MNAPAPRTEGFITDTSPGPAAAAAGPEWDGGVLDAETHSLPNGWRQLATDVRGARLFRVASPEGGAVAWRAEIMRNGELQCRRCASELRARAWLAVWDKPLIILEIPRREGRSCSVAHGDRRPDQAPMTPS
jgi:hypothetical protein